MASASYCVYVHTFPNGKKYVGHCKEPAERRWGSNGSGYAKQKFVYKAITKYGWINVAHNIIASNLTKESAEEIERETIKQFNTNHQNGGHGYNLSEGGESGSSGYKHTEEAKKAMSEKRQGSNHPMYGRHQTDEVKNHLSEINRGEKHPKYGLRGSACSHSKPILCIESGITYSCLLDAKESLNIDMAHINAVCRGKRKTAGGYHWQYVN